MTISCNLLNTVAVESLGCVWLFMTPWNAVCQAPLSITVSPEFAQIHVHWVGDAIQPSHLLSPPFPPAHNLSQHQGLFQWVVSSHQVARVLVLSVSSNVLNTVLKVKNRMVVWVQNGCKCIGCLPLWSQKIKIQNLE